MTDAPPLSFLLIQHQDKYPHKLAAKFPHIVKRIAEKWNDANAMADYFSELMIPNRENRQGFDPEVAAEIIALSMAYGTIGQIKPGEKSRTSSRITSDLWEYERDLNAQESMTMSNFVRAVESGDFARCTQFISAGFDVNTRDSRQWTPLMVAAFNGKEELALKLIRSGAGIHAEDRGGYTPMHWAAFNGYSNVLELLLKKGGSANVTSHAGISPTLQAAAKGHLEAVITLLNGGADPNIAANDGTTALLKAVANGHLPIVNLLLAVGARVHISMKNGVSLIDIARQAKDTKIRDRILSVAGKGVKQTASDASQAAA